MSVDEARVIQTVAFGSKIPLATPHRIHPSMKLAQNAFIRTYKSYGLWKVHREILTPVIRDGYLQIVDVASFRLERVGQIRRHVQHVLENYNKHIIIIY